MLHEFLKTSGLLETAAINENYRSAYIRLEEQDNFDLILQIFDQLKTISDRDEFELFLNIAGNSQKIASCGITDKTTLQSHIESYKQDGDYDLTLEVTKVVRSNSLSIYFIDVFFRFLGSQTLLQQLEAFSNIFEEFIYFEVFETILPFGTPTIYFFDSAAGNYYLDNEVTPVNREERLRLLSENSSTNNFPSNFIPEDFYIAKTSGCFEIDNIFNQLSAVLSLVFISSASEVSPGGDFSYKIFGYKGSSVDCVDISALSLQHQYLFRIYSWAYKDGNCSDKLGLVRNILSIHQDDEGNVLFDEEAWNAINSNYQIYLKKNIHSYLDTKNKIGEIIIDSNAKAFSLADELGEALKSNVLLFLTFIFTIVVFNGIKDNGAQSIFSDQYLYIVTSLCILSALWLTILYFTIPLRFTKFSEITKEFLLLNYDKVIMASEISDIVDIVMRKNHDHLCSQLKCYAFWWIIILAVLEGIFYNGNRLYPQ